MARPTVNSYRVLCKRKQDVTSYVSGYAGKKCFLAATRPRAMCQVRQGKYSVAVPNAYNTSVWRKRRSSTSRVYPAEYGRERAETYL